jgi:glycosyltransferase involved in cell wall biosynthesis
MKKIAIVHDQLREFGGAERVLVALKKIFKDADVYTSFFDPKTLGVNAYYFKDWNIKTSWAQNVPFLDRLYSPMRFITPWIWESFNFDEYDVVISSSGAYMSKGVLTRPETLHICYMHHQPKYLYFYETSRDWQKHLPIRVYGHIINHGLRIFDFLASQRPDKIIANSEETKKRIKKFYRLESEVIYPPVELANEKNVQINLDEKFFKKDSYYITTSRLSKAKHIDILIEASNRAGFKLKIIGSGRDLAYLKNMAGANVEFLQNVKDSEFNNIYKNAKAFLFASVDEEFGIAPVEAMSYGMPIIAYSSGGLKETVENNKNGYLYKQLSSESLIESINNLEKLSLNDYTIMRKTARKYAEQYSFEAFKRKIEQLIS